MSEKNHRLLIISILTAMLSLACYTATKYQGSIFSYVLFTFSSALLLTNGLKSKSSFFDLFLGLFLWLGFWLKFSIRTAFLNMQFVEPIGFYNGNIELMDQALIVSSVGFLGFASFSYLAQITNLFSLKNQFKNDFSPLKLFYDKHRQIIITLAIGLSLLVAISNIYYGFYQKGLPARTQLPFGLNRIITWLILFGLSSLFSFIVYFENQKEKFSLMSSILYLIDCFLSNVSLFSRGFILNGSSLIFAHYYHEVRAQVAKINMKSKFLILTLFMSLFVLSIFVVNHIRATLFDNENRGATLEQVDVNYLTASAKTMFIDRWVGIEGVISVVSYEHRGFDLWNEAWSEKYKDNGTSFYDLNLIKSPYKNQNLEKHHFISLPGMIAFFYYPGSLVLLFSLCFFASGLGRFIESCTMNFSGGNFFFASLISQVVAYRYAHFGYVPMQSYLLIGTIFLTISLFYILNKLLIYSKNFRFQGQ